MIFEKEQDLVKEKAGISMYVNLVGGSFKKLSSQDVDTNYLIITRTCALTLR